MADTTSVGGTSIGGATVGGASTGGMGGMAGMVMGTAGTSDMGMAGAGVGGTDMGTGGASSGPFTVTSANHEEGAEFADKYTCALAGFNGSLMPALEWTPGPAGTNSYAITFIDVTLTKGTPPSDLGYHWVLYNIPADVLSLPEEFKDAASLGASQNSEFLGPCPNFGSTGNTDTYEFRVYALASETLTISPTTGTGAVKDAEAKLEADNLGVAVLSGTSSAVAP